MVRVSVYGPSRRTEWWPGLCQMLTTPSIDVEIILAGPNVCSVPLPSHFKQITTSVKPSQAAEIARRACTGDYIINIADDCTFPKDMLTTFVDRYEKLSDKNIMLSAFFGFKGQHIINAHRVDYLDPQSPIMPVSGFLSKELDDTIGSIDKNFIALYWDLDLAMRLCQLGGHVQLEKDILFQEDDSKQTGTGLFDRYVERDRAYFDRLWGNGKSATRALPVEPFDDTDILLCSQGPKGEFPL